MLFSSWEFIFGFLPATLLFFFSLPCEWVRARKAWLCVASLFFYGWWKVECVPLLVLSIGFNHAVAGLIHQRHGAPAAKVALWGGVAVNLASLAYFKYTNFLLSLAGSSLHMEIALPLAISFFTFTQISYLVDVSRDRDHHYPALDYVLFVLFFPHLIAGPIVRHWEIIPQFAKTRMRVTGGDLSVGSAMFLLGLYKKTLLADPVSVYANAIYGAASAGRTLTWFDAWFGTVAYALQIYFDFSGYSDMAIGLARVFGIRFPANFDSPYRASSIGGFWRGWHMSLTRFLRDYVYIPLGGNRGGFWKQSRNILVTFLLSGIWHGAGWTFVIWGLLHGGFVVADNAWRQFREKRGWVLKHWFWRGAGIAGTFSLVIVAWAFFRSPDLPTANGVISSMFGGNGWTLSETVTNPNRQPGILLKAVGMHFVGGPAVANDYTEGIRLMVLLLLVVWLVPNSQQLLAREQPVLGEQAGGRGLQLELGTVTGLVLGVLFLLFLRTCFAAAPSPFLYFNF